ncbi:hypothetical protein ABI59_11240 [Acidobacteria bacterium Mor1]|nr:hypothetical protein ABI59_11240 [Acidobacteria bacterium Mor1]
MHNRTFRVVLLSVLVCLLAVTAAVAQRPPANNPPCGFFERIEAGNYSGYDADPLCGPLTSDLYLPPCNGEDLVIENQGQWTSFWSKHDPFNPAPTVDFNQHFVVVTLLGERRNQNHSIGVTCVQYLENPLVPGQIGSVRVTAEDYNAGANCILFPLFSNYYDIVKVNRTDGLLSDTTTTFVHESFTIDCPADDPDQCFPCIACAPGQTSDPQGTPCCDDC